MQWDPEQYLAFSPERARPFRELVARIGAQDPASVVDLGCGPGSLTAELAERWPTAQVMGVDSSPEMIGRAGAEPAAVSGKVQFRLADLREWTPERPVDVIVSNAVLQWVPDHLVVLDRLAALLPSGGWLAFQVPGNFAEPTHTELDALCRSERWRHRLDGAVERPRVEEPGTYLARLAAAGLRVDGWETTYLQVLAGPDAVLEWMRGTGLRPVLSALPEGQRAQFEADYRQRLRQAYPAAEFGTLLPYRRIFMVAHRPRPAG